MAGRSTEKSFGGGSPPNFSLAAQPSSESSQFKRVLDNLDKFGEILCLRTKMSKPPSHLGTYPCAHAPKFELFDYNSESSYAKVGRSSYGLSALPSANATLVGLYYADGPLFKSYMETLYHLKLDVEASHPGIKINVAGLNNFVPYICSETKCEDVPKCKNAIAGCPPDSKYLKDRYRFSSLNKNNSKVARKVPYFLDESRGGNSVWRKFGGGVNDILIYDIKLMVFGYACSSQTCTKMPSFSNDLLSAEGFDNIKSLTVLAANSNNYARCTVNRGHDPLLKHFAPTSMAENQSVDVIVILIVFAIGMIFGAIFVNNVFNFFKDKFCMTVDDQRDRFIQLSTIDDSELDEEYDL